MKSFAAILLLLTLLSSCAPKAIVLGQPSSSKPQRASNDEDDSGYASNASEASLPRLNGDELGLLDPKGLTNLPNERDMRPSGVNRNSGPVIANPPSDDSSSE